MNTKTKGDGQIRRSQVITTYGSGALIDLPRHSAIVGGLEKWPRESNLEEIDEPRLSRKLQIVIGGSSSPRLYAPPAASNVPGEVIGIGVWRFPEWFVVQEAPAAGERQRSRRLVHRKALEKGRFDGQEVVATRFVRACPKGHIDDIDWYGFVHGPDNSCRRQLWLDEFGTSGDLSDLRVRCSACGKGRGMHEAKEIETNPLGTCQGTRPWLGRRANEPCNERSRLLIRTASNAYFPQVMSVLSLPDRGGEVENVVKELWDDLQIVDDPTSLAFIKKKPKVAEGLATFSDDEVIEAINQRKRGSTSERPVKQVELEALMAVREGFGDVAIDPDFHARRLPDSAWRTPGQFSGIKAVIQVHRLREVLALVGFTRFEAVMPDIHGEYDTDVELAQIALEPSWFPAVENRGEGVFLQLCADAVRTWRDRSSVQNRIGSLAEGHKQWIQQRDSPRQFPDGPYVLLHTLSHLLLQSLSMRCGYPATSIRERIYVDEEVGHFGLLLYTASPDAEGTLGGLVQQARYIEDHIAQALGMGELCSNDPVCAQHTPGQSMEERWLHGAACHGCALVAETSCEMRNDYLDRALVVPVLGVEDAAFFDSVI